ncbi:MAG TPA: ABC transporter permease [Ruminiclostridium sp.]|nr:ABC transporter permease [Ruminiclostridium sp.]
MKIFFLAFANMRKRKSAAVSLFILVLLSTLMLNIGLTTYSRLDSFLNEKTKELNGADFVANITKDGDLQKKFNFVTNYKFTEKVETEDDIFLNGMEISFGHSTLSPNLIILNADEKRTLSPLKLVDKLKTKNENIIYLPYILKSGGGYKSGDTIKFSSKQKDYSYTVGGFFEDTLLGSSMGGSLKAFLPEKSFIKLRGEVNSSVQSLLLSAKLSDSSKSDDMRVEFDKMSLSRLFSGDFSMDVVHSALNYTMAIKFMAAVLIAFALIILLVSLIVVKFRVSNSIEDDMLNIGALKAIGYTSTQIYSSIVLQFFIISFCAGIAGIIISHAVAPILGGIISSAVGLLWNSALNMFLDLISLCSTIVLVLAVTLISSSKVKTISPITALRSGIQTHSFKRNFFPLEKTRFGLQLSIGLKNISKSLKQNVLIALIIAALCFACSFSSIVYFNFKVDKSSLFRLVGAEHCNVLLYAKPDSDPSLMFSEIGKMNGVKKTGMLSQQAAIIKGSPIIMYISDNYDRIDWQNTYKGRQPKYDNEVAVSGMIAKKMGKTIGDTIKVSYKDKSYSYLITGLSQQLSNPGRVAALTLDGYKRINPDYKRDEMSVYLSGIESEKFIKTVKEKFAGQLYETINMDTASESEMGSINNAIFSIMSLIIVMTLIVVSLILYLLIKAMLIKHKRDLGIFKAIGYTTIQLMTQTALSFVPVVLAGSALGGLIASFYSNTTLSLLLASMGIYNATFKINIPAVIYICVGIAFASYLVSMLVSYGIRKITAYGLITE